MKILVGCEESGIVAKAFRDRGHDAVSCDLIPGRIPEHHRQCDVLELIREGWDLGIFFPPCTDLCVSGARWFKKKQADGTQQKSIDFFMALVNAPIPKIATENPVGIMSNIYRKPDQIIQPWQHGHGETKATCLWLKNLPKIVPSNVVEGREQRIWKMAPSEDRAKLRSETFTGVAKAMAEQWG
jgi:hypothetical protein